MYSADTTQTLVNNVGGGEMRPAGGYDRWLFVVHSSAARRIINGQ